jgi:hypothetical protein
MLLLTLLPNVRTVQLGERLGLLHGSFEAIETSLSATAHNALSGPGKPLSRVVSLTTATQEGGRALLQRFDPFMILPNLRVLRGSHYLAEQDSGPQSRAFEWRFDSLLSNLETIEMARGCVSANGSDLASLLSHTSRLRVFRLEYQAMWLGVGYHWNADALFQTLEQHCRGTIGELSVTIGGITQMTSSLASLKAFTHLEHLELDVRLFYGPYVTKEFSQMAIADYWTYAKAIDWGANSLPNLIDILPESIKSVRLISGYWGLDAEALQSLFNITREDRGRLPLLETVVVHRGTSKIGNSKVYPELHDPAEWKTVGELIQERGFVYEEFEEVRASWLENWNPSEIHQSRYM